jgi:glutamate synthase domain-containing protein 2
MKDLVEKVADLGEEFDPNLEEEYIEFINSFVPKVMDDKSFFSNAVSCRLTQFVTYSDEALAVLLLLNSYERWIDQHVHPTRYAKAEDPTQKDAKNAVKSSYTSDGYGKKAKKGGGWKKEGHDMMLKLCRQIKRRRKKEYKPYREFMERYRKKEQAAQQKRADKKKKAVSKDAPAEGEENNKGTDEYAEMYADEEEDEDEDDLAQYKDANGTIEF